MNINPYERFAPFLVDAFRGGPGPEGTRTVCHPHFNRGVSRSQAARLSNLDDDSLTAAEIVALIVFIVGLIPFAVCIAMTMVYGFGLLFISRETMGDLTLLDPRIVFPTLIGGFVIGGGVHFIADFLRTKAWALANDAAWDELGPSLVNLDSLPGNRSETVEALSRGAGLACSTLAIADPALRHVPEGLRTLEAARTAIAAYIDAPAPSEDGAAMYAAVHLTDPAVRRAAKKYVAAVRAEEAARKTANDAVEACIALVGTVRKEAEDRRLIELANA